MDTTLYSGDALLPANITLPAISLAPAILTAREAALEASRSVREITDAESLAVLADAQSNLRGLRKLMDDEHKRVKAPLLDATRGLDTLKKDYLADIEVEERRLSLLLGAHQAAERRKAEEARRAAEAEAARIRAEAQAAEAARVAVEHQQGRSGTLLQDVAAIRAESLQKEAEVIASAATKADIVTGGTVRQSWKFEVTDIHALYAAQPNLVKLEPNRAAILAIVKTGAKLPGVHAYAEVLGSVKPASLSAAQIAADYDY